MEQTPAPDHFPAPVPGVRVPGSGWDADWVDEDRRLARSLRPMSVEITVICSCDPIRIEGRLADGRIFFFQARDDSARLEVWPRDAAPAPGCSLPPWRGVAWVHEIDTRRAGQLSPREREIVLRDLLLRAQDDL